MWQKICKQVNEIGDFWTGLLESLDASMAAVDGDAKPPDQSLGLATQISTRATLFFSDSFIWEHFIQNRIHVKITHPLSLETTETDFFIIISHL